jgi:putative addiction module antidote
MVLDLKIRKIGNSHGVLLPKEALARLNASEGDTLVLTETPDGGFRVTPDRNGFGKQMRIFEDISRRYQNALRELAK